MTDASGVPCDECGRTFPTTKSMRVHSSMVHGPPKSTCDYCEGEFELSSRDKDRFCSLNCYHKWMDGRKQPHTQNRETVECKQCGNEFELPKSQAEERTHCGLECRSQSQYKGNQSLNREYRDMENSLGWKTDVYERDNYTCSICGQVGGDLQAHHITPVSELVAGCESRHEIRQLEKFGNVDNGVTLCVDCHDEVHSND